MTCAEHYFENLLYFDKDTNGDVNKNKLSKEVQEAIEMCYQYVVYSLFFNDKDFKEFMDRRHPNNRR